MITPLPGNSNYDRELKKEYDRIYPNGALGETMLDEIYARAAANGDKLEHLSKKKRQQIRGVDYYKCSKCGFTGPPWMTWLDNEGWTCNLDIVQEDVIVDGCKCGGTVVLIDD